MLRKISEKTALEVAIESTETIIPTEFTYTCLCWLNLPLGFFSHEQFHLKSVFAVGTKEGPIVIMGFDGEKVVNISLLCGHTSQVTSIVLGFQPGTFFSISNDSEIIAWSAYDGSCLVKYTPFSDQKLDFRLEQANLDANIIFIWDLGGIVRAFNTKQGNVMYTLPFYGVNSFSCTIDSNVLVSYHNKIAVYSLEEQKALFTEEIKQGIFSRVICTYFGVVHLKKNKIIVYNPNSLNVVYSSKFKVLPEDDSFYTAVWETQKTLIVFSMGGFVVTLDFMENDVSVKSLKFDTRGILLTAEYTTAYGAVLIDSNDILYINKENKTFYLEREKQKISTTYCPDFSKKVIYKANGNKCTSLGDSTVEAEDYEAVSDITCISSNTLRNSQFIITGTKDGNINIFSKQSSKPFISLNCMTCPIVGICTTPFQLNGSDRILAIGSDGSLCLFNFSDSKLCYLSSKFDIVAVYSLKTLNILIVEYIDGRYEVFNLEDPAPIRELSTLVDFSKTVSDSLNKIWCYASNDYSDDIYTLGSYSFYSKPINYSMVDINRCSREELEDPLIKAQANKIIKIISEEKPEDSLVIIGADNVPTFLYPGYTLADKNVFETSPFISAIHWIAYESFNTMTDNTLPSISNTIPMVECLPVVSQLIFIANPTVARQCSMFINNKLSSLDISVVQSMVAFHTSVKDINELQNHEKLMLGIASVFQSKLIRRDLLTQVFNTMVGFANSKHEVSHVARIILVSGIQTWFTEVPHSTLYTYLLKQLQNEPTSLYGSLLAKSGREDIATFLEAIEKVFPETIKDHDYRNRLLTTLSNGCFAMKEGYLGTLTLIRLMRENPSQRSNLVTTLNLHCAMFKNVDSTSDTTIIGLPKGSILVFHTNGPDFEIPVFNSKPIGFVKILGEFAVVVSFETKEYAQVLIPKKKSTFGKGKAKIIKNGTFTGEGDIVSVQIDDSGCHFILM